MDIFAAMKAVFIGVALLGGVLLSIFAPKRWHDSKIEEGAEKVIEVLSGHDIDLTPNSPEPEDFVETLSDIQEDEYWCSDEHCFEDNWDTYFHEDDRIK